MARKDSRDEKGSAWPYIVAAAGAAALYGYTKSKGFTPNIIAPHELAGHVLEGCVAAPLKEEFFYRGAIEGFLTRGAVSENLATFSTSAAFAAGHIHPKASRKRKVVDAADAFFGGVVYSIAAREAGLGASILVHACHNLGVYVGGVRSDR